MGKIRGAGEDHRQNDRKTQEMFDGFTFGLVKRAKESDSYFVAEALVLASVKSAEGRKKEDQENSVQEAHGLFNELVECMNEGDDPGSKKVQGIIKRHHAFIEDYHDAAKRVYKALAELYSEHPAYRKQFDPFHPNLAKFLAQGMRCFAESKL